jgi:hypothetical protein
VQELNLNVSTEELLSAERAFTFVDLHDILENEDTIAWLTQHAAVSRVHGRAMRLWNRVDESYRFVSFSADGKVIYAFARSHEALLEICDVVVRLLAVSVVHAVNINQCSCPDGRFINAPTLAYLMEQCQSLKFLSLKDLKLDENHCRVLGTYSRPDLEIVLKHCTITSAGASALAEVLGRDEGPTKLDRCRIDSVVLANGLRGNSRLKNLKLCFPGNLEDRNRQILAIAGALRENKGLVDLDLSCYGFNVSDETWDAVCDSLKTHPTLQVLNLRTTGTRGMASQAVLQSQIQALVGMMKVNMSIHTIHLDRQHELFQRSLIPYPGSGRVFLPSNKHARLRTVPTFWDERFLHLVLTQIAFGCYYQGMPKLPFCREPRRSRRLRTSLRLLLLPLFLLQMLLLSPLL